MAECKLQGCQRGGQQGRDNPHTGRYGEPKRRDAGPGCGKPRGLGGVNELRRDLDKSSPCRCEPREATGVTIDQGDTQNQLESLYSFG